MSQATKYLSYYHWKIYEELLQDIHDLVVIAERKDEPVISLDELKRKLKSDGLI